MNFNEELQYRIQDAEDVIYRYLPAEEGFQKTVLSAMDYAVRAGGKRLRPIIMRETCRLFDGHSKAIEPFMAAMEFIHTSSLVHDDLPCMDNDTLRRGKPSVWAKYGEDMGTLAGDALMLYAFEVASKAFSFNADAKNVGRAIGILANKSGIYGMVGGQTLDVEMTGKPLDDEQIDYIYENKTAALLEASMMIGAVLADASKEDILRCEKIASKIGVAFQIQDDILDITSTEEMLGKPIGSDEENHKVTYVTLHTLEGAKEAVERLTNEAIDELHLLTGENLFLEALLKSLIAREK
ncbi:MAG: polyprenyl synthetase family protein [Lachnospiraceae bacterium]|nr:polyprenyl synthetase family protein [Lachnospiraceae bacterium]